MAITSALLAAVAVAFNGSLINYRENRDIFEANNRARQALCRITAALRNAAAVEPNSPANECTLITDSNDNITYRYVDADDKLYLITNDDLTDDDYLLCDNVTATTFSKDTDVEDGIVYVKSVRISLTTVCGNTERTVSGGVVIRRNLK